MPPRRSTSRRSTSRRSTSTSPFGVSKREGHDATGFYRRFTAPDVSADEHIHPDKALDKLIVGDARQMSEVPSGSVALVVTSPPYFAGKEYEEALGEGGVPGTYVEYLQVLRDVLAECVRTLEPGGRVAVNIANLGRRPYRSLSADVIGILQDDLRLLLRGEIVWVKQRGSSGSCAWGSFQRPANPVLRDLTERVVVASKGRFDRAVPAAVRAQRGLPSEASMTREDFMENTLDVWEIPPESATRVGHPAPFPVELPARLIELYTYRDDLVLDPFLGSGSTAVAAVRTGRHYVGYDLDPSYIRAAEQRLAGEADRPMAGSATGDVAAAAHIRAAGQGMGASAIARSVIEAAGFTEIRDGVRRPGGVVVDFAARDRRGLPWCFLVAGGFTSYRGGLARMEPIWKALAAAVVLRGAGEGRVAILTTALPPAGGPGAEALRHTVGAGKPVHAAIEILDPAAPTRLAECATTGG